jgi:hypothetical protein
VIKLHNKPGLFLQSTHVWAGTDRAPKKKGVYDFAPGSFGKNNMHPVANGSTDTFTVNATDYYIVHASMCIPA